MNFPNAPFQSIISEASGKLSSVWSQWFAQAQRVLKAVTTAVSTTNRPNADLFDGQTYYDTDRGQTFVWTGSEWRSVAVGYYAAYYDTTNQTAANTTTAYPVTYNQSNGSWNVSLADSSKITVAFAGTYNIQFSLQFVSTENNANNESEVDVWFKVNGTNVDYSNSRFSVPTKHGAHNGHLIAALNFITELEDGDYVQLMWRTSNTLISMESLPASSSPTRPVSPSAIITINQV